MKNLKNLPHESGIYRVFTNFNNACYIGQAKDIYKRFNSHHKTGYLNPKDCCYNTKFYVALRQHGIDNFEVEILELCSEEELDKKEVEYIKKYDSFKHGYNSTEGGQYWSPNVHSKESEQKRKKTRELNQSLKSENHPRAKLTNDEVLKIRQRYIDGQNTKNIWYDYKDKYSYDTFKRIVFGYTYKDVGNVPSSDQIRYTNAKLTNQQVREIKKELKIGKVTQKSLAQKFNVSTTTISRIARGLIYKHID